MHFPQQIGVSHVVKFPFWSPFMSSTFPKQTNSVYIKNMYMTTKIFCIAVQKKNRYMFRFLAKNYEI